MSALVLHYGAPSYFCGKPPIIILMPNESGGGPRVLVVDDEDAILGFADRTLQSAGYDVVLASNGPDTLRIVSEVPTPFDLFVIDVMMPIMRGDELGRRLRERDPDAKILYFTGYADRLFEERGILWENEAFVEKPVSIKGLLEAVSMLLFGHTRGVA